MPLPLAPLMPLLLRIGAAAVAGYAASRWISAQSQPGRLDLRAEDALDDLDEGLAFHRPRDLEDDRQGNAALRLRRRLQMRGTEWELDAGMIARIRLRRIRQENGA